MAKTNTEKPSGKAESKKQVVETPKQKKVETPVAPIKKEDKKVETKEKLEEEKKTKKVPVKKVKKSEVFVDSRNLHISTKYAASICKFIKNKTIERAINDLEDVLLKKKLVPMKGEYAHKKGKGKIASGSGKYPLRASREFIVLLKSLRGNANNHDIDEPVIVKAIANIGERPFGRFGSVRRKRTHVKIIAREKKDVLKMKKNKTNKLNKKNVGGKK